MWFWIGFGVGLVLGLSIGLWVGFAMSEVSDDHKWGGE
jgi:hypothetical protein